MKPVHRSVNNIGYKKIYPMSSVEDNTICHYCGRSAGHSLKLTNDHVPPLNVRIPPEFIEAVKKTLVRACSECNSLAGDIPHMDYLERHLWLKARYIQRYKSLIVSHEKNKDAGKLLTPLEIEEENDYNEVMQMLGFGLIDSAQIESPLLRIKTKSGVSIAELIDQFVYGVPDYDYDLGGEEDESNNFSEKLKKKADVTNDQFKKEEELGFFLDFLCREHEVKNYIETQSDYMEWAESHPSRFYALELPESPQDHINLSWDQIMQMVDHASSATEVPEEQEEQEDNSISNIQSMAEEIRSKAANKAIPKFARIKFKTQAK